MPDDDRPLELWKTEVAEQPPSSADRGSRGREFVPGQVISDRYEILDVVGEGGMGRVFKAEDLTLHEMVALKVLDHDAAEDDDAVRQFHREVKLARRVSHRNVVRTYDIGTDGEIPFLTMEYLQGEDLRGMIHQGALSPADALSTGRSIAAGLAAAHEVGVLHRDLKPGNVLVGESGRVALTDFGIAGALRAGGGRETLRRRGVGTPAYMAPEQLHGDESMDQRVDLYAFGLLIFEMTTGRLPWRAEDPMSLAVARIDEPAPSLAEFAPELPGALVEIVDRCLNRDPGDRPGDADRLAREIGSLAEEAGPVSIAASLPREGPTNAPESPGLRETRPSNSAEHETDRIRVVVLPFDRAGAEEGAEVAAGIREDLIYRLGHWDAIEVRLRELPEGSALGENSTRRIGRRFGADAVVRGDITVEPESVRARAAVVSVASGDQLWGDVFSFDGEEANDVAARIAGAIGRELTGTEPDDAPRRLPTAAHSLLTEAQHLLRERWRSDVEVAVEPLERAHDLAPEHPRVLSQLAVAHGRLAYQHPDERERHVERAIELARSAIDRAGDQWAQPRHALATAHFYDSSYGSAVATLRAALEREPDYAEAHELLGRIQAELGPLERAIEHLERALELNPYLHRVTPDLMRCYGLQGRWDEVDELAERELSSEYVRRSRAMCALRLSLWNDRGSLREILESDERLFDLVPADRQSVPFDQGLEVLRTGTFEEPFRNRFAEQLAEWPESRQTVMLAQAGAEASIYAGELDSVFEFVDIAIEAGLTDLVWLEECPLFDDFRDDPEYIRRLERVRGRVEALELS